MLSAILKFVAAAVVLFLAYKAASIYALFQFADHMRECLPASGVCRMAELKVPQPKIEAAMAEALSCARQKQTKVEALLFAIPKNDSAGSASSTDDKGLLEMCKDWGQAGQGHK